ncbi:unnamed protein product [Closterium sp. Naga37s-1]|nr:unnamed protein product [Closterium sp. Naga37s-1]
MSSTESESLSFRDVVFLPADAAPPYSQEEPDSPHSDSPRSNQRDADVLNDRRSADINQQRWGFLNDRRADFNGSSVDSRAAAIDNLPLQPTESNGASLEPPAMRLPSFSFVTAPPVEGPRKANPPDHERGPESGGPITAATDTINESSGTSPQERHIGAGASSDYVLVRLDGPDLAFPLHTPTPSGAQRKLSRMLAKKRSDGCEAREVASSPYRTSPSPDSPPQSLSSSAVVAADASRAAILPPTYLDLASPRWRVGFSGSRHMMGLAGWRRATDLQVSSPAAGSTQRAAGAASATAVAAAAAATAALNSSLGFGLGGCAGQPLVAEEEEEDGEDEEEAREAKGEMIKRALPGGGRADSASPRSPREFSRQNAHNFPPLVAVKDAQALVERMMGDAEGGTGGSDGGAGNGKRKFEGPCSGLASSTSSGPAVIKVVDHLPDVACADVAVEGKPWEQAELAMKEWTATVAMLMAALQSDDVTAASAGAAAVTAAPAAATAVGAAAAGAGEAGEAGTKSTANVEEPSVVAPPSPRIPPLSVKLPLDSFSRPRPRKATSPSQQATSPSQQATSPSQHASSPSQHATSPSDEACTRENGLNVDPSHCTEPDVPSAAAAAAAAAAPEGIECGLQDSFYSCRSSLSFSFASDSFNSSIRSSSISSSSSSSNNGSSTTAADATTTITAPPTRAAAAAAAAEAAASISLSSIVSHLLSNAHTLADPSSPPGSLRKSLLLAEMFVAARRSAPVFEAYLAGKPGGHVVASDWSTQLPRHLAEGVLGAFEWVAVGLERAAAAAAVPTRTKISARQQLASLLSPRHHKVAPLASPRRASPPLLSPRKSSPPPASPRAGSPVGGQGDPKPLPMVVRVVGHVEEYGDWDTPAPFIPPPNPDAPTASVRTYGGALASIFREFGGREGEGGGVDEQGVTITGLTERIMGALMGVVEGKAAACDDDVIRALFMLNNTCVIQQACQRFPSISPVSATVEDHSQAFLLAATRKLLQALPSPEKSLKMSQRHVEERLSEFNKEFESLSLQQLSWPIVDDDCRVAMRKRWAAHIESVYSDFVDPHL